MKEYIIEAAQLSRCVKIKGLNMGPKVFLMHRYHSLPWLKTKDKKHFKNEFVNILRITSESTFDRIWWHYQDMMEDLDYLQWEVGTYDLDAEMAKGRSQFKEFINMFV